MQILGHLLLFVVLISFSTWQHTTAEALAFLSRKHSETITSTSSATCCNRIQFWKEAVGYLLSIGVALAPGPAYAKSSAYKEQLGSIQDGLQNCPGQPVKKSCWSTEDAENRVIQRWEPPTSIQGKPQAIVQELEETINMYPQSGQHDVDRGGWKKVERNMDGKSTYLRYEFTSGRFKYIDDLEFLVEASGKISVRTASRNAGYDYNVNATRINYIMKQLERKGWKVTLV